MFTKMSIDSRKSSLVKPKLPGRLSIGLLFILALLWMPVMAEETESSLSNDDTKCLKCHSKTLKKKMEDGEKLSLHVEADDHIGSVHSSNGCASCHTAVAERKHPKTKVSFASKRAFSIEQNQACSECHEEQSMQYEGSIHASLVSDGNQVAPVCTDCHSAHAIKSVALYEPVTGESCKACHESIFEAYEHSVHGEARTNGNVIRASHIQAPICADCHRAHETTAVAAGDLVQTTCLTCHEEATLAHEKWLPNAEHHLEVVSCAACHAPMAERRIDLQLYDKLTQTPVGNDENHGALKVRLDEIDEAGDGLDPVELWKLVRQTSQEGKSTDVTLRGRMEVTSGADAHRLAVKASAVRECESCHIQGSSAFENVTVSINRPDGRKQRYEADNDVLTSVVSVDSIGGFYAAGGTRIKLLDGLLILGLIGGLAIPVGHVTMGKLLRKKQKKGE